MAGKSDQKKWRDISIFHWNGPTEQTEEVSATPAGHLARLAHWEGRSGHSHRGCRQEEVQDHPPHWQQSRYYNCNILRQVFQLNKLNKLRCRLNKVDLFFSLLFIYFLKGFDGSTFSPGANGDAIVIEVSKEHISCRPLQLQLIKNRIHGLNQLMQDTEP